MSDTMNRRITIIALFSFLVISLFLLPLLSGEPSSAEPESSNSSSGHTLTLRLHKDELCLFKDGEIIQVYDINPSVLPGEDIKLLTEGINVDSIADANTVAEDFDG